MSTAKKVPPTRPVAPDWQRYEQLKQQWIAANPNATAAEYDAALRAIAEECGV